MNNTKWKELQGAILQTMPFPPPYIMKMLFEENCSDELHFQKDVCYLEVRDKAMPSFAYAMIKWIKDRPCYLKYRA